MSGIPQPYGTRSGPERRRGTERRTSPPRREEIRFEPTKAERRSGSDRRKHGGWDERVLR